MALHVFTPIRALRFATPYQLPIFLLVLVVMNVANVTTTAVRFQKKKPYLLTSLLGATMTAACTYFMGAKPSITGVAIGYAFVM